MENTHIVVPIKYPEIAQHLKDFGDNFADESLNHTVAEFFYLRGREDERNEWTKNSKNK